jgi:cell division protease FtsH
MLSPEERKRTAYHEAGHCVVAAASGRGDQVHRVSIHVRGKAVGSTSVTDAERSLLTQSELKESLTIALGGIAAEELVFGEPSTGAENDLEQATDTARDMVARYGMSAKLGRPRLVGKNSEAFLNGDIPLAPISGMTHQEMDAEVRALVADAESRATDLLDKHRMVLDTLAARLEAEETLEGPNLEDILSLVRPEVALLGALVAPPAPRSNGRGRAKVH